MYHLEKGYCLFQSESSDDVLRLRAEEDCGYRAGAGKRVIWRAERANSDTQRPARGGDPEKREHLCHEPDKGADPAHPPPGNRASQPDAHENRHRNSAEPGSGKHPLAGAPGADDDFQS